MPTYTNGTAANISVSTTDGGYYHLPDTYVYTTTTTPHAGQVIDNIHIGGNTYALRLDENDIKDIVDEKLKTYLSKLYKLIKEIVDMQMSEEEFLDILMDEKNDR